MTRRLMYALPGSRYGSRKSLPGIRNKELPQSIKANVIYVKEEHPAKGLEPIEWFLMTNDEVNSVEQALEKVRYYVQ
jgi:hypothetical protein